MAALRSPDRLSQPLSAPGSALLRRASFVFVFLCAGASACGAAKKDSGGAAPLAGSTVEDRARAMLERVAKARGLPIKRAVTMKTLDRAGMSAQATKEMSRGGAASDWDPKDDALAALGLVPPSYDFAVGKQKTLESQIIGFYSPTDGAMYLAADLGDKDADDTLAHELAHALQDQSFAIGPLLSGAGEGDSDKLAAISSLIEGDATSAGFDITEGSALDVSEEVFRRSLSLSATVSSAVDGAPRVIEASISAPYVDGFSFVQALRRRGGWRAVDEAWRSPPTTTEQLLHIEKFDAREPPIEVPEIPFDLIGSGFRKALDDRMGEQGLRVALEEWAGRAAPAEEGARGWGGDRYIVVRRDTPGEPDRYQVAAAWLLRFDTEVDASEVASLLDARFGDACVERPDAGPLAWRARGADIAIAAGPFERRKPAPVSMGKCSIALKWAQAILDSPARQR